MFHHKCVVGNRVNAIDGPQLDNVAKGELRGCKYCGPCIILHGIALQSASGGIEFPPRVLNPASL